jgi:hypothetical protein
VGYAPHLTKCGSTSTLEVLRLLTRRNTKTDAPQLDLAQAFFKNYTFISFLRNPLERALAGFHQMEIFIRMGWLNAPIEKFNLTWWNEHCTDSDWGDPSRKYVCKGSTPHSDMETRLRNLVAYLEEVKRVGFFDEHHTPLTYQLARWERKVGRIHRRLPDGVPKPKTMFFDLALLTEIKKTLAAKVSMRSGSAPPKLPGNHRMGRKDFSQDPPWIITWGDLIASTSNYAFAARRLLCNLYKEDVQCLSNVWPVDCHYETLQ